MFRKVIWILLIAGTHFVLGRLVIPLATNKLMAVTDSNLAVGWVVPVLIWITRVLYFPIISLSWYSRNWFPGDWIYIPIGINSFLWGDSYLCCCDGGKKNTALISIVFTIHRPDDCSSLMILALCIPFQR